MGSVVTACGKCLTCLFVSLCWFVSLWWSVLGVHLPVVSGRLRYGLGLRVQQRLVLFGVVHAGDGIPLAQALGVGRVQLLFALAASLQPAGGRLLHHPRQPGRGQRQHVQKHSGE